MPRYRVVIDFKAVCTGYVEVDAANKKLARKAARRCATFARVQDLDVFHLEDVWDVGGAEVQEI